MDSNLKFLIFTQDDRSSRIENLETIELRPISSRCMPALICQLMNVEAVQEDIVEYVFEKINFLCHFFGRFLAVRGMAHAGYCQSQLKTLLENDFVQITEITSEMSYNFGLIFPDHKLLKPVFVRVPSFEEMPPPRANLNHPWPNDIEFRYKDDVQTLAMLGSTFKRRRTASYLGLISQGIFSL